ncbi:hypothetical protein HELRODRAFT_183425 [Helobdella robusta]|uniref:Uncharacterized protein n=1 Tax=Helobdella robusta TaxID=6412 RepID=T1FJM5_HELRO|nr:hypothetical protein HELRODRAFT_183425 [Helobdella robusta]ESO11185.1 hypothetical protein HELRODRAFT_183425 [Helobdella robusta]
MVRKVETIFHCMGSFAVTTNPYRAGFSAGFRHSNLDGFSDDEVKQDVKINEENREIIVRLLNNLRAKIQAVELKLASLENQRKLNQETEAIYRDALNIVNHTLDGITAGNHPEADDNLKYFNLGCNGFNITKRNDRYIIIPPLIKLN